MPRKKRNTKGKGKAVYLEEYNSGLPSHSVLITSTCTREKTPEKKREPPPIETPIKRRFDEWDNVWCGSLNYFFDHVLPPIRPEFDIDQILSYCIEKEILQKCSVTGELFWEGFPQGNKDSRDHETNVYNKLCVNIINAITRTAHETSGSYIHPTTSLHSDGSNVISLERTSGTGIDIQLYSKAPDSANLETKRAKYWYDSAFIFHLKETRNDIEDNTQRVINSLQHRMSKDPCRRFTLGATIDDTRMVLWFACRGMIIASHPFDFNNDPLTMVKVVLSLVFADKVDLGWDPTITAQHDGTEREFAFDIDGNNFKTSSSNIISGSKANRIFTAGTRIYKAFKADDMEEKEPVIIKDFWPIEDFDTEDVKLRKALADIKDDAGRTIVEDLTLTTVASGRVKVRDQEEHTILSLLRGKVPESMYMKSLHGEENGNKNSSMTSFGGKQREADGQHHGRKNKLEVNQSSVYVHRWHYRIVIKEVAIPYNKLRNLKDMGFVLYCAVKALRQIHEAGWVHRDISPGNLYLYTNPVTGESRGLIGDFEFAKRVGTGGGMCDNRVGTPDYTAIEVAAQAYQFKPKNRMERRIWGIEDAQRMYPKKGVWANYIHDLESIWWIAIWTLFAFQETPEADSKFENENYKEMIEAQRCYMGLIFPGKMSSALRAAFLVHDDEIGELLDHIPDDLQTLRFTMMGIRDKLLECYTDEYLNGKDPITMTNDGLLHNEIMKALKCVAHSNTKVIPIRVNSKVVSRPITKLPRITYDARSDVHPQRKSRTKGSCETKISETKPQRIPSDSKREASALCLDDDIDASRTAAQEREPEEFQRKTRTTKRRGKSNTDASLKPVNRSRAQNTVIVDKELAQGENRRITRSMTKNAVEATANTDVEARPSKRKRTGPEGHATRSKRKRTTTKVQK